MKFIKRLMRSHHFKPMAYGFVFAVIGVLVLLIGHALTPTSSVEPENGTPTNNATVINDPAASGGKAVQFGGPTTAGFVHTAGMQLLDGNNKPLQLKGANIGGWLSWEGWIWGNGFDYVGQSTMMNNLTTLVGSQRAQQFRADVHANFMTLDDYNAMASYGLNVARVGFNYRMLEDDNNPGNYKDSGWTTLDNTINHAQQAGVYVVLDMHVIPCSQTSSWIYDYDYDSAGWPIYWNPPCQDRTVKLWKAIAARYADKKIIAGYDLINEPYFNSSLMETMYKNITREIRTVDKNHVLIYEGDSSGHDFSNFTGRYDDNQMISVHDYSFLSGPDIAGRMADHVAAARRLNSPIFVGEFGQIDDGTITSYKNIFKANPEIVGWTIWTWKEAQSFSALQKFTNTTASKKLVDWINNNTRPKPTPAEAEQGMNEFITAIKFSNTLHNAQTTSAIK